MACPGSIVSRPEDSSNAQSKISDESGGTNKKQRLYSIFGMNQLHEGVPDTRSNEGILLDKTG